MGRQWRRFGNSRILTPLGRLADQIFCHRYTLEEHGQLGQLRAVEEEGLHILWQCFDAFMLLAFTSFFSRHLCLVIPTTHVHANFCNHLGQYIFILLISILFLLLLHVRRGLHAHLQDYQHVNTLDRVLKHSFARYMSDQRRLDRLTAKLRK